MFIISYFLKKFSNEMNMKKENVLYLFIKKCVYVYIIYDLLSIMKMCE